MQGAGRFERIFRKIVTGLFVFAALGTLLFRFLVFNVIYGDEIIGPPFFSTLVPAYLPLATVFALAAWKLPGLRRFVRIGFAVIAAGYAAAYVGLSVRHFWRGPDLSVPGFSDPELYTYTVAMLLVSGATMFAAFLIRSVWMRKLAMAGIGLTIAKVFFVDMAGLSGLIRVVSFMGLGLALLALTWVDRLMAASWERPEPEGDTDQK